MRLLTALTIYRLLLPLLFLAAFPGWVVKMLRRDGFGTRLGERAGIYSSEAEWEPSGVVHFHAVSVGESMLALKLIREWLAREPERKFLLATGTATGHAVATAAGISHLRVTYAPLDFPSMVRRYLDRFEPRQIVLIEGEIWPHLLLECKRRNIPVWLVNARMSPRSARRFRKFAAWLRPIYQLLSGVAIQETDDAEIWRTLGIAPNQIHHTGSLKFDPSSGARPQQQEPYQTMIDRFGKGRPVVLAASTHEGEEEWIAAAIRAADARALAIIVPRHAERREDVRTTLELAGFAVRLRSEQSNETCDAFVIDSTGELRDWTAHADVVIIGKSFLSTGGQNPCEAILANKPLIFGPHMENFQPLARRLVADGGCILATNQAELTAAILVALDPTKAAIMTHHASAALASHDGATRRILALLMEENHE